MNWIPLLKILAMIRTSALRVVLEAAAGADIRTLFEWAAGSYVKIVCGSR
jgi:hypothetical protein